LYSSHRSSEVAPGFLSSSGSVSSPGGVGASEPRAWRTGAFRGPRRSALAANGHDSLASLAADVTGNGRETELVRGAHLVQAEVLPESQPEHVFDLSHGDAGLWQGTLLLGRLRRNQKRCRLGLTSRRCRRTSERVYETTIGVRNQSERAYGFHRNRRTESIGLLIQERISHAASTSHAMLDHGVSYGTGRIRDRGYSAQRPCRALEALTHEL
jgi:hypothetical protein